MAHDVFISYSTKNANEANGIVEALERHDVRCWIAPRDIDDGDDWADAIAKGVRTSAVVAVVLSAAAVDSPHVARELALAEGSPIFAIRIEPVEPSDGLRYFLATAQWMDAFALTVDSHHERIVASTKRLVDKAAVQAAAPATQPFVPPAQGVLDELATRLSRFLDLSIKLLAVLGERSRVLVQNEAAHVMLLDCTHAFNGFAPGFIADLPGLAASIRRFWGTELGATFAGIQATIEEDVYRGGFGSLNDERAQINNFIDRDDVADAEWETADGQRFPRLRAIRTHIDDVTKRWAALRTALDQAL